MKIKYIYIRVTVFFISFVSAQFKHDLPLPPHIDTSMEYNNISSLFNLDNINMNHGFSISSLNYNNLNISMAQYTNSIYFPISKNIDFSSRLTISKSSIPFSTFNQNQSPISVGYDFGLKYQTSSKSFFKLNIHSNPYSQNIHTQNKLFD
mgnify:CR=1 FL=1